MDELEILRRRVARESAARKEAERIAEEKTRELYEANKRLLGLNERLQDLVDERTAELVHARDQAIAASRAKSVFLANMSHELRTPLNAIIGYSEMIIEEHEDGDATLLGDVRKIHGAGKHLLTLINDVLDLSKIEAGKMALFRERIDVADLIAGVVETVRPMQSQSSNALTCEIDPGVGALYTDAVKLRQILLNLLSNALKFTQQGRVALRVRRDAGAGRIHFEIEDNGIGIPKAHMEKLFAPFSQADASTTRRFGGTGLGLALSQKFCSMLGGEISVESEEGKGSTFRFWLPSEASAILADSATGPADAEEPVPLDGGGRQVVLVIDDDLSVHELLQRHLAHSGFRAVCTTDPVQALALARELRPAIITLDVLMPRKDGWSVLSDLKQDSETRDIPVILLSIIDERGFGFALGAADYLLKPIPRVQLLDTLRRHATRTNGPVLLVEDDPALRSLMARALHSDGWNVVEAENGRAALGRVSERMPGIVLLDLMMPEMDGFQFVGELHKIPGGREIPIVVVTAKELTDEDVAFFRTRANAVLRKCVYDREQLLREVQRAVERSIQGERAGQDGPTSQG